MVPYLSSHYGNPSSTHAFGRAMREAIEKARSQVAELIGSKPEEICFTSGGTESNNLAIRGVAAAQPERRHLLTSAIEHPATLRPCELLQRQGYAVDRAPVNSSGQVMVDNLLGLLRRDTVQRHRGIHWFGVPCDPRKFIGGHHRDGHCSEGGAGYRAIVARQIYPPGRY